MKKKFEEYFVKRCNPIYKRAKFNQRSQKEGESVVSFVTVLHVLAKHCGYGPLHDKVIRDQLKVSLEDARLSQKLEFSVVSGLQMVQIGCLPLKHLTYIE